MGRGARCESMLSVSRKLDTRQWAAAVACRLITVAFTLGAKLAPFVTREHPGGRAML
jgi:hypothetical protein